MKLISLNIEVSKHYDTVLPFLKRENADVVCLQELPENDFDFFKNELNLDGVIKTCKYINYPYEYKYNGKRYGVAIFAKNIIDSGSIFYFGREENMLKSFEEHLADETIRKNSVLVWADVKASDGQVFKFLNTHMPVTKEGEVSILQIQALESMLKVLDSFSEFILCGDMNAPRGRQTFDRLAKKYKDNIPLGYKTSIDLNLHRAGKTKPDELADKMVDALFTTPLYVASNVKLIDGVSDHMAVVAVIEQMP